MQKKNSSATKEKVQNTQKTQKASKTQQKVASKSRKPAQAAQTASKSRSKPRNGSAKKRSKGERELPIKISFLGGLNEVGKNMTLYEYKDDMFLVDCGLAFPDSDMPGVDLVIPDFTYVERNADKIKGIVITHGHEDHIGGLAYLLKTVNIPVYGTKLTIGLIQGKLKEHGLLSSAKLHEVAPGDVIKLGEFTIEMIHVNHSIPDAIALAIKCDCGTVVQTGDFKIDSTPIDGGMIDLARFAELGSEGVLCLLSDSTNAERPGYTESERKVGESFEVLFRKAGRSRIIVATLMPHGSVASSSTPLILALMTSREVRVWSSSISPMMFLSVVAVRFSIAASGRSTPYAKSFGSVIWKKTTVSICMVTLSLVITGWGGKSTICSLSETCFAMRSMKGILTCMPVCQVALYAPRRSMTYAFDCGTILTFITTIAMRKTARNIRMMPTIRSIVLPPQN